MTLTVRSSSVTGATTASRALTHAEMDENWNHVANFAPSGTGAVSRPVQDKERETPSVQDFGASITASAATNTTAFNAALAAHSVVSVPGDYGDVYDLNSLTALSTSKILYGRATLRFNTSVVGITVSATHPGLQDTKVIIQGLTFKNVTNTPSAFIKNDGILDLTIRDCNFLNCAATWCVDNTYGYGTKVEDCAFFNVTGSGVIFRDDGAVNKYSYVAKVSGCDFSTLTGKGIEIEGCQGLSVSDTILESITGVAMDVGTAGGTVYGVGLVLTNVLFEGNTGTDLNLQSSGTHYSSATLNGCTFIGSPTIALGSGSQIVIDGVNPGGGSHVCTISGSGTARATFLGAPTNYTQSGTFQWFYNDAGTWTPVLTFDTPGDLNVVYSSQVGRWTRTADTFVLTGRITTSTFTQTTASGSVKITGSPVSALNAAGLEAVGSALLAGVTKANYTQLVPMIDPGTAVINFYGYGSGQALSAVAAADMPTGVQKSIYFTLTFKV